MLTKAIQESETDGLRLYLFRIAQISVKRMILLLQPRTAAFSLLLHMCRIEFLPHKSSTANAKVQMNCLYKHSPWWLKTFKTVVYRSVKFIFSGKTFNVGHSTHTSLLKSWEKGGRGVNGKREGLDTEEVRSNWH